MRSPLIVAAVALAACGDAPGEDLSTDDAIRAAYERHAPAPIATRSGLCIARSTSFDRLVLVSDEILDLGCEPPRAFYRGRYHARADDALPALLGDLGWSTASDARRAEIAEAWFREVIVGRGRIVTEASDACLAPGSAFHAGRGEAVDGGARYTAFVAEEDAYFRVPRPCARTSLTLDRAGRARVERASP